MPLFSSYFTIPNFIFTIQPDSKKVLLFFLKCEWIVEFPAFGIPATSVQAFGGFNTTTTSASAGLGGANFGGFGTAAPVSSGKVLYKEKITLVI